MIQSPLDFACPHIATPQEQGRDPHFISCAAEPGQPCRWARRYDGASNPTFHAERLELASALASRNGPETDPEHFQNMVLSTGLV